MFFPCFLRVIWVAPRRHWHWRLGHPGALGTRPGLWEPSRRWFLIGKVSYQLNRVVIFWRESTWHFRWRSSHEKPQANSLPKAHCQVAQSGLALSATLAMPSIAISNVRRAKTLRSPRFRGCPADLFQLQDSFSETFKPQSSVTSQCF